MDQFYMTHPLTCVREVFKHAAKSQLALYWSRKKRTKKTHTLAYRQMLVGFNRDSAMLLVCHFRSCCAQTARRSKPEVHAEAKLRNRTANIIFE